MAASATNIQVKRAGIWRTVTEIKGKNGGSWRAVTEVWAKDGGTWRHSWINSDPQTFTWYASDSQTFRSSGAHRSTSYLYQGYFSGTYGQHRTLMTFDYADIQATLATRPVTDAIHLRMNSEHFYNGWASNPIGSTRHCGTTHATIPTTWDFSDVWGYGDANGTEHNWPGGFETARDQQQNVVMPVAVGDDFRDGTIKALGLNAEATTASLYCYFWGHGASASLRPQLSITCDYS